MCMQETSNILANLLHLVNFFITIATQNKGGVRHLAIGYVYLFVCPWTVSVAVEFRIIPFGNSRYFNITSCNIRFFGSFGDGYCFHLNSFP